MYGSCSMGPCPRADHGEALITRQVRTCNKHGPLSLLRPLEIGERNLHHIAPPGVQSGVDYRG